MSAGPTLAPGSRRSRARLVGLCIAALTLTACGSHQDTPKGQATSTAPTSAAESPPPTGSSSGSGLWVGGEASTAETAQPTRIRADVSVFNRDNKLIGPLRYRRSFDQLLPATFEQSAAAGDATNGYRSFVSWKPPGRDFVGAAAGKYDAAITSWARSVPRTGVYATCWHEPEDAMTGPQFVAMQRHLYRVVKKANPTIQWGPVYTAYWWQAGTNHYVGNRDAWWPGNDAADFTAVDTYTATPVQLKQDPKFMGWYSFMATKRTPLLITEYGRYVVKAGQPADPVMQAKRAAVIRADAQWIKKQGGFRMWLIWNGLGPKGDWRLTDPASQRAFREVAAAGRTK